MNELALYAGTGGGILGSQLAGWRTIAAVELDPFAREIILRRQADGVLPVFPVWDDCHTFDGRPFRGVVDFISAGFPCQPFSVAGSRLAGDDERNEWPSTLRILDEVRPRFALLENVPGLLAGSHGYFGTILGQLADCGFDAVWRIVSAADIGAPHLRKRLWVGVANADGDGLREFEQRDERGPSVVGEDVTSADGQVGPMGSNADGGGLETFRWPDVEDFRRERRNQPDRFRSWRSRSWPVGSRWFDAEPGLGRMVDGCPDWLDRTRALGLAQVPAVVFRVLTEWSLIK